jgi:pimeloyl-ACP methyl ester carboxylesterase
MASPNFLTSLPLVLAEGVAEQSALWQSWVFWILVVLLLLIAVAFVYFVRLLRIALRLFVSTQMPGTSDAALNGTPLAGELHPFPSRDGTGLVGLFIEPPPGVPVRGTVVFAHEYKGDLHTAARYTSGLGPLGYRVFAFDFRGHGQSDNSGTYQPMHWVTDHEVNDVLAAVGYVASMAPADHPIGVMGVSRGACAAVIAALHTPKIRALVLDGLFSTDLMVESLMHRYAQIFASTHIIRHSQPIRSFAMLRVFVLLYAELKLRCRYPLVRRTLPHLKHVPTLFLYGGKDTFIDAEQWTALYRIKPGVKQLVVVPEARHNQAVLADPHVYARTIGEFLGTHLAPAAGGDRLG